MDDLNWPPTGLCVGIDPLASWERSGPIHEQVERLVRETAPSADAFKFNYWSWITAGLSPDTFWPRIRQVKEQYGKYIILDAKFADVLHIAELQAEWVASFGVVDAVTVVPYGLGSADEFQNRGLFVYRCDTRPIQGKQGNVVPVDMDPDRTRYGPYTPLLIPGVGPQGRDLIKAISMANSIEFLVSASRLISEAPSQANAAEELRAQIAGVIRLNDGGN